MPVKGTQTRLLVNQWDFSGVSNALKVELKLNREECTVFQATAKEYVAIDNDGTISQQGYFVDSGADTFEEEIAESILNASSLTVAALVGTSTAACPAYVARDATTNAMKVGGKTDGLLTLSGDWISGGNIFRGLRAFSGTISATGTQTYIDLGAAGSAGGYGWLFVQTITGTATSATITVQSDDNTSFTTPATEGTFTFSAVGAYEIALTGTVDRYVRLNCTSTGGATSFVVVGVVAVSGVTY